MPSVVSESFTHSGVFDLIYIALAIDVNAKLDDVVVLSDVNIEESL